MRVDEPGHDVAAARVDGLQPLVRADTCDETVDDGDVRVEPFAGEDGEDAAAPDDEIGGLVAAGDGEAACEPGHGRGR